jgi:hypothetical protein
MKPSVAILFALLLSSCVHKLTLHARDGERLDGRWRFAREGSALIQVFGPDGEVLIGMLTPVARGVFLKNYEQAFGAGSIDTAGPELSSYGNAFWSAPGTSNTLADVVYGETFDSTAIGSPQVVTGPLFYWTANLQGDKRTLMQCFLIGSSHSAGGLGRCKGSTGKEYTVRF